MADRVADARTLMDRALALAERGRGWVEPNPMVGAVLARPLADGGYEIVAEGWHERFGGPHAEAAAVEAAKRAGVDPRGLTLAVTLEPCSHHGKTPPCAEAVIAAGIGEAIIAMIDPFESVSGRGVAALREAGVGVTLGVGGEAAAALNAPFVKRVTRGLPWVIAKWAQTIDGKIAARTGDSRWISNPASRRLVHRWRGEVDAVMVGVGTAAADDPRLTARDVEPKRLAHRVVVDPALRLPPGAAVLQPRDEGGGVTTVICGEAAEGALPDRVERIEAGLGEDGRLDLAAALRELVKRHETTNVLVEGGAGLVGSLVARGLVDELRVFVAPKLLGDPVALSPANVGPAAKIDAASSWRLLGVEEIEGDVLLRYAAVGSGEGGAVKSPGG